MLSMVLLSLLAAGPAADAPAPTPDQLKFFETQVRPLLAEHCQQCHGAKKQWGSLRLDSREAIVRGGDSGPAIDLKTPAASRLIRAVRRTDDELKMPPEERLSEAQIQTLLRWIELGAPYPTPATATNSRSRDPNHWAFQPATAAAPPTVRRADWPRSPVDQFVLARLEAADLAPAAAADRRALLRRTTFDLIGLPPTLDEIDAFTTDDRPDAFERLVDRLLASPAYGERWGRHWLDVARYADSNGLDENVAHGNAWRYRDYVVASLNADKPYGRFVQEQLAGDLLSATDDAARGELLIATGFLAIGAKVLAEVDESKMQMDIVDEQIDTVGRAMLGLTLGCARCHDHKFDPIDTIDYYGLAGVFKSTRTMETFVKVAKWHENPLPSDAARQARARYDASLSAKQQGIDAAAAQVAAVAAQPADAAQPANAAQAELQKKLQTLRAELTQLQKNPPDLPSAMGVLDDKVADVAVHVRGSTQKLGAVAPRHVPVVFRGPTPPSFSPERSGRLELARWLTDPRHPLTSRVLVNRVWRWHFGKGLVRTADNFGLLGEPPTHPELLDWLAVRFVDDGGSLKLLHRQLTTSNVYRQTSSAPAATLRADPENRLWGRTDVRRLEAEPLRDSLLAVGRQLDQSLGGSLLKVKNRGYLFDHTSKDTTDYSSRRRSLYLPVIRNNVYDLFQLLDFPDAATPSGDRATTTIAPQALWMLNGDLAAQSAEALAGRVLTDETDDAARLRSMVRIAYGREATLAEQTAQLQYLDELERAFEATNNAADDAAKSEAAGAATGAASARRRAWNVLAQTVLAANEFVYLK